jgi:serine O-acetyltransferase
MSSTPTSPNSPVSSSQLTSPQGAYAGSERGGSSLDEDVRSFLAKHFATPRPPFVRAIARDALTFALHRGEAAKVRTRFGRVIYTLLLPFRASEYFALVLYRLRAVLRRAHIPLLPALINWTCALGWGIRIGDHVVIKEGVYIPHGQIVIDGPVVIGSGCVLCPWITIGLVQGDVRAPQIADGVFVGTGAKMLGPLTVGYGVRIGANAVVLSDVPAWSTAVGVPARIIPMSDRTPQKPTD